MPFALTPALVPSRASRRAHATCGGATSTPRSLSTSTVTGDHEAAPAHPLGLLRVQGGYVVSAPRWIQPSEQGVEIGALATGEGDITDVGDDVSARHAHVWCDDQNAWYVEDLSSTNGTVVVNGATNVCTQVEPGRRAQLNPGDELRLGESTTYAILLGAL
ncbi:FHA domain-containing protein [Collinsella aerofaciens]|uniref:FHA domain-containing protein n=1 Tax=Collinsella aerofaciens TaxID=74426 RepID=UPI0034A57A48